MAALSSPLRLALAALFACFFLTAALPAAAAPRVLRWGADLEGGAPFVMPDPADPDRVTGFEAEIMAAVASRLGARQELVHVAWDGLVPALMRGDFDLAVNGLEVTPDRARRIRFSRPYYVYTQQIVVRAGTRGVARLADLEGERVGTIGGTVAERLLRAQPGIEVVTYGTSSGPYDDLLLGRVEAVLLDTPIASVYGRRPGLVNAGPPFGPGYYAMGVRKDDAALEREVTDALGALLEDGTIAAILKRYDLWNDAQRALFTWRPEAATRTSEAGFLASLAAALPLLARGTAMTIAVSLLAMALAVAWGLALATGRLYGPRWLAGLAAAYVEVFRGTPLLIQLFLIYYGLPSLGLQLPAFAAAVVGLGLNYAAYEAENYRAGITAVPRGQMEAATALGMSRLQAFRHVALPQALRIAIPPVTNDFIALFKDSSIVSIITLVELTKVYGMLASSTYNHIGFGLVAAAIYFAIAYPASRLALWLERRLEQGAS